MNCHIQWTKWDLMIYRIINLSDIYFHHYTETALAKALLTLSLKNSLDIYQSSLPYLNFVLHMICFSFFILFKVIYIYIYQKVLRYDTVINNPQIYVAYNKVVYSSLIYFSLSHFQVSGWWSKLSVLYCQRRNRI